MAPRRALVFGAAALLALATRAPAPAFAGRDDVSPLADLLQIVVRPRELRAIGFDGGSGNLVTSSLGPRERVVHDATAENVGVIVTDRRALGVSPFVGGFFEVKLQTGEAFEALVAAANLATLTTSRRILIFRAETGSWEERQLDLRE